MDDRDLEARLRTHLHRRFDAEEPPPSLVAGVIQAFTTKPRSVAVAALLGRRRIGWSAVAAAAVVAALAFAGLRFGFIGPGDRASPSPTLDSGREFVLVPPRGTIPDKADGTLASNVVNARLRGLIFEPSFSGGFTVGTGYGITVMLPNGGPSDRAVRDVLEAIGEVEFVPLPPEDYGDGKLTADVGQPLPKVEPTLFSWDGIATVERDDQESGPAITITLKPAAQGALEVFSIAHVSETLAILVDGKVAILSTINEPLSGALTLTGPRDDEAFAVVSAILIGGMMLPESWRGAEAPEILSRDHVTEEILRRMPDTTAGSSGLEVIREDDGYRAIWRVVLDGQFPVSCPFILRPSFDPNRCEDATTMELIVDAETGAFLSAAIT